LSIDVYTAASTGLCAGGTFIVVAGDLASNARCRQIYDDGFNVNDNNPGNAQFDCAIAEVSCHQPHQSVTCY
jgi:hypothetical protein